METETEEVVKILSPTNDSNVSQSQENENTESNAAPPSIQIDTPTVDIQESRVDVKDVKEEAKNEANGKDDKISEKTEDVQMVPVRQYLDKAIVPILLQALAALAKERPTDAIDFVANYLLREKTRFSQTNNETS